MTWRPALCLNILREQVDRAFPDRPQAADGMIGDARHQAEKSDHNPLPNGVVTAWDITTDDRFTDSLAEQLRHLGESKDGRVKYVIFKGRIAGPMNRGWRWRPYSGFSQHFDHIHLSVAGVKAQYDRTDPWPVVFDRGGGKGTSAPITPAPEDDVSPEDIEAVAQRAAELVRRDLAVIIHGTKDGTHPSNLDRIASVVDAIKKKVGA